MTCCMFFSVFAIVFHIFIGVLLSTQPEYIIGIEDPPAARGAVFGSGGLYLAVFMGCCMAWMTNSRQDIDEVGSSRASMGSRWGSQNQFELHTAVDSKQKRLLPSGSESNEDSDSAPLIRR